MDGSAEYPTPQSDTSTGEALSSRLQRLSAAVVEMINERDFSFSSTSAQELVAHLAPGWRAQIDTTPDATGPRTWDEQIAAWKERAEANPNVRFEIQHISSTIHEGAGEASVFLDMEVTGVSNVTLHAMNEIKWRRVSGTWLCYYVIGMRGSLGNRGFDD